MTDIEHLHPEKELTPAEIQALLGETVRWIDKIIKEKPFVDNPQLGRAMIIDDETDIVATVVVGDLSSGYMVEYSEANPTDSSKNIAIEFALNVNPNDEYTLLTSGEQPDVIDEMLDNDVDDETFAQAVMATQRLQDDNERPATPEEIKLFHTILELAAFGDEKFDHDTFQWQFDDYVADLEAMKEDIDTLDSDNRE